MNNLIFSFVFLSLVGCAHGPDYFASSMKNEYGLNIYSVEDLSDPKVKVESAFIYTLLANTSELRVHQMNGAFGNEVYVKNEKYKGGYPELVIHFERDEQGEKVDGAGVIVRDCENKGSFNYKHPHFEPLGHFSQDSLPWMRWGNCPEDTTTQEERVEAYTWDVRESLEGLILKNSGYYLPVGFSFSESGQSETVAFLLAALKSSDLDLYDFVMNHQWEESERFRFYQALENGINQMLSSIKK